MRIIDIAFQDLTPEDSRRLEQSRAWTKTLVVQERASALDVARRVDIENFELVVVTNNTGNVLGGIAPRVVIGRASEMLTMPFKPDSFSQAVSELTKVSTPDKIGFEWLNVQRPDWHWCEPGNHLTSENPCSKHEYK